MVDYVIMNYLGNFYYLKEEGPPEDGPVILITLLILQRPNQFQFCIRQQEYYSLSRYLS